MTLPCMSRAEEGMGLRCDEEEKGAQRPNKRRKVVVKKVRFCLPEMACTSTSNPTHHPN